MDGHILLMQTNRIRSACQMLDFRAHVRGEVVGFAVWASLRPQNVPTWMTVWALRMALPQNPTILFSAETVRAFIWDEVILLSPIFIPALTMYRGSRLTIMSPGTGLFKQLLVKLCKSWGRRPSEANSGLLSFRQQYPELTQRRRSVSSCQGRAMKKKLGNENVKSASENRNENDFLGLFDQNAQFREQLQLGLPPTSHFPMCTDGLLGLCVIHSTSIRRNWGNVKKILYWIMPCPHTATATPTRVLIVLQWPFNQSWSKTFSSWLKLNLCMVVAPVAFDWQFWLKALLLFFLNALVNPAVMCV